MTNATSKKPPAATNVRYWLMKSEPDEFSIDDLKRHRTTAWSGVRNYQARNYMRDDMKVGDEILFYHSSAVPPGVAGLARVSRAAYPDLAAQDPQSPYYDPKATPENPIWLNVEVEFVLKFNHLVTLEQLRSEPALENMLVLKRGVRLSIQPVEQAHFARIRKLGGK